ncbi:GreA/GreB family elongation factor [Tunicatimonas pelagia]|uniref:GreA/GreB family elongation factor n=1 Tax=Tunicatimonas pelagia TaxID=931531 RepID=UPI00266695D2|nr:GreA/GreB family elongation factor [Tunicatimonas pelagia]WKN43508.1 GreA/GreB family elongation factor [Tunicatimonas pelagia]
MKRQIFENCKDRLEKQISGLQTELQQYKSAVSEETKSSVGDKYETGRAMLHLEQERLFKQLTEAERLYNLLASLEPTQKYTKVLPGSLVETNQGHFYFAVGLGQVKVDDLSVYCVSLKSPVGQALVNRKVGEEISFQQRMWKILNIV